MDDTSLLRFTCPKCQIPSFDISQHTLNDIHNHIDDCYRLRRSKCPLTPGFKIMKDFLNHFHCYQDINTKSLRCPVCSNSMDNEKHLVEHYFETHHARKKMSCPICNKEITDETAFIEHLESRHSRSFIKSDDSILDEELAKRLPKEGDRVIAMWEQSKWQYFTAKIKRFMKDSLKYEIDWDDGDSTGRIVDYFNIAKDRVPTEKELGTGSIVLFAQGTYVISADRKTGGKRWHEGIITNVDTLPDGSKIYHGCHTKTVKDEKFVTYRGYSHTFSGLSRYEFRIRPNVFEVIDDSNDLENEMESSDVFFSYNLLDSFTAYKNREINDSIITESHVGNYENMCDPHEIESFLRKKGYSTAHQVKTGERDLKSVSAAIKNAKVFVACISNEYVNDENCKMEFQFASISLRKPVIPLVVGNSSSAWSTSVVGMLIAGKLFIHFKEKEMQDEKKAELLSALSSLIKKKPEEANTKKNIYEPIDIFLSYCWKNSFKAEELKQVDQANGSKFADPRLLKDMITNLGYKVWLDIEQLSSANADSGLFGQITEGIKAAKVVIPCISDDYSKSANCRMEFQFALKSLNKPIIPVVVGKGSDWRQSVVGALMSAYDGQLINLQDVWNYNKLKRKLDRLKSALESKILIEQGSYLTMFSNISMKKSNVSASRKFFSSRAPKIGDHVLCHHFKMAYYMATVISYNTLTMTYTVDWDDGDPTGREALFNEIAIDIAPEPDDIGVGSYIFFPQGSYVGTEGNNIGGNRYHEGEITSIKKKENGLIVVSGHHTKSEDDGKWIHYREYSYDFIDIPLSNIRLAPTALEAMFVEKTF